jgi:hypothetical protein
VYKRQRLVIALVCAFASFFAVSALEYVEVEEDFRIARFEAQRVGTVPDGYVRPNIYVLTQLDALLEAARISPAPELSQAKVEMARNVALRFPWPATQNRYALALALTGNSDEALRQLKTLRAMHGEKTYASIRANWVELARTKFPQLGVLDLP